MDDINFEDLCLDPYKDSLEEGKIEGRIAGLQAGFKDGRSLGRMKGLEIGIELGYMRGVAVGVNERMLPLMEARSNDADGIRRVEKIRKVLADLVSAIDAFPSPDEMFSETNKINGGDVNEEEKGMKQDALAERSNRMQAPGESLDVAGKLQRVRAKFKLLTVQLKLPQLSLKRVMDAACSGIDTTVKKSPSANIESHPEDTAISSQPDTDW